MSKVVRLTEADLVRLVKKIITEQNNPLVANKMGDIETLLNQYKYKQVNSVPKGFSLMPFEEPYMGIDYPSGFSNKLPPIWVKSGKGEPVLVYLMKKDIKSSPKLVVSAMGNRKILDVLKSSITDVENSLSDTLISF